MIREKGFTAVEIILAVVILGIVGLLGWKFFEAVNNKASVSNASEVKKSVLPDTLPELADLSDIKEAALLEKPGVTVIHIELESSADGVLVFKAQLSDGSVVVYNARTGKKVNVLTSSEKSDEILPATFTGGIGFAQAIAAARTVKPTGDIYKVELELEDGIVVFSVRFSDKARVDVNAESGEIIRTKAAKTDTTHPESTSGVDGEKNHDSSPSSTSSKSRSTTPETSDTDADDPSDSSDTDDLSVSDDDDAVDGSDENENDAADDSSNSGSGR